MRERGGESFQMVECRKDYDYNDISFKPENFEDF